MQNLCSKLAWITVVLVKMRTILVTTYLKVLFISDRSFKRSNPSEIETTEIDVNYVNWILHKSRPLYLINRIVILNHVTLKGPILDEKIDTSIL